MANVVKIDVGSGNLKGSCGFGDKTDYTYDLPVGVKVIGVAFDKEDKSKDTLNIGGGNGNATLKWDKSSNKAHVHAWVNGAAGAANEVRWTVYAWIVL